MPDDSSGPPEPQPDHIGAEPTPVPEDKATPKPKRSRSGPKNKPAERDAPGQPPAQVQPAGRQSPEQQSAGSNWGSLLAVLDRAVKALPSTRFVWMLLGILVWIVIAEVAGVG